jgi:hypothetical protein
LVSPFENVLLGTSGWSYREWIGPFYAKGEKSMLKAHSKVFKTAEINSTFYAYPSKGTVMGWTRYTPEDHVFCVNNIIGSCLAIICTNYRLPYRNHNQIT